MERSSHPPSDKSYIESLNVVTLTKCTCLRRDKKRIRDADSQV